MSVQKFFILFIFLYMTTINARNIHDYGDHSIYDHCSPTFLKKISNTMEINCQCSINFDYALVLPEDGMTETCNVHQITNQLVGLTLGVCNCVRMRRIAKDGRINPYENKRKSGAISKNCDSMKSTHDEDQMQVIQEEQGQYEGKSAEIDDNQRKQAEIHNENNTVPHMKQVNTLQLPEGRSSVASIEQKHIQDEPGLIADENQEDISQEETDPNSVPPKTMDLCNKAASIQSIMHDIFHKLTTMEKQLFENTAGNRLRNVLKQEPQAEDEKYAPNNSNFEAIDTSGI